jgi:hypothetical protein
MELVPLNCNECGAPLKVGDKTKFVTCKKCGTQLAVRREDGATFTEVAQAAKNVEKSAKEISGHARVLRSQNERLLLQGELERLDRDWERERDPLMLKSKGGSVSAPTRGQAIGVIILAPLMLTPVVLPVVTGASFQPPALLWVLGVGMALFLVLMGLRLRERALRYEEALARYDAARSDLLEKLRNASSADDDETGEEEEDPR